MSLHYYNEFNPQSAAMLRQMISDGLIPGGVVDERSILEVTPDDLKPYTQCHFFAGIGGWQYALQLAGWPPTRSVWTGSAPCQPFSAVGNQKGTEDERHLFPAWLNLIRECQPATVYGEQVAPAIAHGWLDDVYTGLESEGYAVGAAILPACAVGAPHRRDRLWFVAHNQQYTAGGGGAICGIPSGALGNATELRVEGGRPESDAERWKVEKRYPDVSGGAFWAGTCWERCADRKSRPIKPGLPLLAYGVQHRKPILHAIGNAIVPQVGAEFIKATMDWRG